MVSFWVAITSFIALIVVLTAYALGFPVKTGHVPYAFLGLFLIGIISGTIYSSNRRGKG